jgi:hypothetical protein
MPRGTSASAYENVRRQALSALGRLRRDIRTTESQLSMLRKQEEQLLSITGMAGGRASNGASASSGGGGDGGRMNWRVVLEKLPKRFKAADVRGVRGMAEKRSGEIFAAITRWIDSGLVKRKERGVYERA